MLDLDNKLTPKIVGVEADVTVHTGDIKALQVCVFRGERSTDRWLAGD